MRTAPALTTAVIGLSLLALTACSSDAEPEETPTDTAAPVESQTPEETESAEPTETATAEETEAAEPAGDRTAPGTDLATSEPMHVLLSEMWWDEATEDSVYEDVAATYAFSGIREGQASDLSDVFGDDDIATLESYSIWFVDYTVTLEGGPLEDPAHSITEATELEAIDSSGAPNAGNFIFFDGGPEVCGYADLTLLRDEGSTPACLIVAATQGETIARLEFHGDTSGGRESVYDENPVSWVID